MMERELHIELVTLAWYLIIVASKETSKAQPKTKNESQYWEEKKKRRMKRRVLKNIKKKFTTASGSVGGRSARMFKGSIGFEKACYKQEKTINT